MREFGTLRLFLSLSSGCRACGALPFDKLRNRLPKGRGVALSLSKGTGQALFNSDSLWEQCRFYFPKQFESIRQRSITYFSTHFTSLKLPDAT